MGFIYQAIQRAMIHRKNSHIWPTVYDKLSFLLKRSIIQSLLILLRIYRYFISPFLGNHCRFYPSCSEYAQEALVKYNLIRAIGFILCRVFRCHPFHAGGYDPLPLTVQLDDRNTHLLPISAEKIVSNCSHIIYMLRVLNYFFHRTWLKAERFSRNKKIAEH